MKALKRLYLNRCLACMCWCEALQPKNVLPAISNPQEQSLIPSLKGIIEPLRLEKTFKSISFNPRLGTTMPTQPYQKVPQSTHFF